MNISKRKMVETVTLGAALTALVVVLQFVSMAIRGPAFSVALSLIPIVIGAATCGKYMGAWLGLVFGVTVLVSGDAAGFMGISMHGTIITVLAKGIGCGFFAGLVYELLAKKNDLVATFVAALVCPLVNTGIFLIGCFVFFKDFLATQAGSQNLFLYLIVAFVGFNILFELAINVVLAPVSSRLIKIIRKM